MPTDDTAESGENTSIFFRLDDNLKAEAERRASEEDRTVSSYLRELIRRDASAHPKTTPSL